MRDWARHTHGSPLYEHLADVIANDAELIRIINRISHRPPPNVLLAGVQFLLGTGTDSDLADYYASLSEAPLAPRGAGPAFRSYVIAHEEELVEIGNTRYAQTNECRRCVALLPMTAMARFEAFHLIDVGTSAGLNLALDRYRYRIGDVEWGSDSEVLLVAESRGEEPVLPEFEVQRRIGLDLNPIDPSDAGARRWLDALIWPEHRARRQRLHSALEIVSSLEIELVLGDALATLEEVLAGLPAGEPVVIMNSFALNQFTPDDREAVEKIAGQASLSRPVHRVSMEVAVRSDEWAQLAVDRGTGMEKVGQAHPHGEWIDLYARP